ncbi:MAG: ABC transporter permease [Prolixibacteraceae bacterium]|nr:ABC transporter permease [Prolixibacteraceae bacterium]
MLKLLLKFAGRSLLKNKFTTAVNVLGLMVAFVCALFVFSYTVNERSYDRWLDGNERLYRVVANINMSGIDYSSSKAAPPLAKTLVSEIPEVEKATRIWPWSNISVKNENHPSGTVAFNEKLVLEADSNFFDLFRVQMIEGDPKNALKSPNQIVITEETAVRYFGNEAFQKGQVCGKPLFLKLWGNYRPYQVAGICKPIKEQTHFDFDILFSSSGDPDNKTDHWLNNAFYTYAMLTPNANPKVVESKLGLLVEKYINKGYNKGFATEKTSGRDYWHLLLQPITSIHLHSNFESELKPNNNVRNLYISIGAALLVWVVAFLNYINLFTVNNFGRAKEIALRKISGAGKSAIFNGFIAESMGVVMISMVLALITFLFCYPMLESISPGIKGLSIISMPSFYLFVMTMIAVTGFGGGAYAAAKLMSVNSMALMKNAIFNLNNKNNFRQIIVTTQFAIAIILISVSVLVSQQLDYLLQKNPGYDQEHVVVLDAPVWGLRKNFDNFKTKLLDNGSVASVTTSHSVPGDGDSNTPLYMKKEGEMAYHLVIPYHCSYDFVETIGLQLIAGRDFSKIYDDKQSVILSESAAKSLGLIDAVGSVVFYSKIRSDKEQLNRLSVVGVVKDVHFESYYKTIRPFAILFNQYHNFVSVRVKSGNIPETLAFIEKQWKESYPDAPYHYSFLDKKFETQYQKEVRLKQFIMLFSTLAILIAAIGLFAMALHIARQRNKEISIRKVNGATIAEVLIMLNRDFVKWVAIAFVIATPIAYYAMNKWLENFAYKTELSWWIFALSGLLALGIALLTVSWQSWKAATRNPVEALRYE